MLAKFTKLQSLGNDFILLDSFNEQNKEDLISKNITHFCDRHFGIGADGVLLLTQKNNAPFVRIFNADGSEAELCLNGARCVSYYLYKKHGFPKNFTFTIGKKKIEATILETENGIEVLNKVAMPNYIEEKTIKIPELNIELTGHVIDAGNPHFVIFQTKDRTNRPSPARPECPPKPFGEGAVYRGIYFLKQYGKLIESHDYFPNKTNVEFVKKIKNNIFELLVFERGCGITLACGSGAVAVFCALLKLHMVCENEKVVFQMLGGKVLCWLEDDFVHLQADSHIVFEGNFL